MLQNDTIAAIATPSGEGALAIVRMSGPDAAAILARVFEGHKMPLPSHTLCYGKIPNIDEVMCTCMYAPRSYTREDVVEIYCHGGSSTIMAVLAELFRNGARPAEPGEFTKRAFLNGRIDLSQAEAVMELINAKTDLARRAVLRKLSGGLSSKINIFRDKILTWLAHIELSVDYPEHEEEAMNLSLVKQGSQALIKDLQALQATAQFGQRIKTGVPTVIVGKPNVGKSSLMNAILQEERAIVTNIPGTTRDTLTEQIIVRNIPILLTDTAGIREGADQVEQIGINRTKEHAQAAELILHVLDQSSSLTEEDLVIAELNKEQKKIFVFNKSDLGRLDANVHHAFTPSVEISAKTGEGLDELYQVVEEMFLGGEIFADGDIITQARHVYLLDSAIERLKAVVSSDMPEDIIAIDLKAAYVLLGEIIGEAVGDDVLDRIFEEFCLGK